MPDRPVIEIYYADICGLCHKAMDYFRSRGLDFTAHEVFWDAAADRFTDTETAREMHARCGGEVDFVPQIFVRGTHIPGWRTLEPMIANGAFDRLLAETR